MRIAMISSECEPYAKTGGLADVVDALSRALGQAGHQVDVYLPLYRGLKVPDGAVRHELEVTIGTRPPELAEATGGSSATGRDDATARSTAADGATADSGRTDDAT